MDKQAETAASKRGIWMALVAALLGWMFDGFEMGMFPLVGRHALDELLQSEIAVNSAVINDWFAVIIAMFLVGAATGGVIFGWLGDRIGRVRAMSLSIFTYAVFTGLCGFASEAWHIAVLRFIASLGMGGEWALGVALVIEIWPDRSRAFLAGLIGAAANVGFLCVALLSLVLVRFIEGAGNLLRRAGLPDATVDSLVAGDGWRLLMIAGALPALLIFFIRIFVPESHKWETERAKGATSHWATRDVLGVVIGALAATTLVFLWSPLFDHMAGEVSPQGELTLPAWATPVRVAGSVLTFIIALVGYMFPVVRYLARAETAGSLRAGDRSKYVRRLLLGACLSGVALMGTWGLIQWSSKWAIALADQLPKEGGPYYAKEFAQIASASGAIIGTILAALAGGWLGRRVTYAGLCVLSFVSLVYMYQTNDVYGPKLLACFFLTGGITAAFYGWFPLYLPELFPTSIRATSQGFAYNFGRVLSAAGSLQTATLTAYFAQSVPKDRIEIEAFPQAGTALAFIYFVGLLIIWLGPETKGKPLPE
ncbi:MAG TPA: MFS transporter [Lacipirellulaceae bacterium]|nr:MFS transporter [Lacipirellulaceae bacterium]